MPSACLCSAADRRCCGADGPVDQAGSGERQEGGRGRCSGSDGAEVIGQKAVGIAVRLQAMTVLCSPPRLQQDRLEAARMAEDMARKAAAEAVRQLEEEHSAKILIDSPPESNEP